MNRCTGILALVLLTWTAAARGQSGIEDQVCGPRCVQHILEHYGIHTDLMDLIAEIQQSEANRGSSLAEVRDALVKRGIFCQSVRLGFFEIPSGDQPVILHCGNNHFVVLDGVVLDGWDGAQTIIWDGLYGVKKMPWWRLRMGCSSGMVLLTSHKPIVDWHSRIHSYRPIALTGGILLIVIGGCILSQHLLRRFFRRSPVVKNCIGAADARKTP